MLFLSIEISEVMDMKGKRGVPLAVGYCVTIAALLCAIMGGSRAVTVISENLPIENRRGIVIDPAVFTTLAFVTFDASGDRSFSFARDPGKPVQS